MKDHGDMCPNGVCPLGDMCTQGSVLEEPITGRGTLYRVVNGRMVKASEAPADDCMDIEQHDHKHGNSSATRYTRRALQRAEHLGTLSNRWRVGRKRPSAA